jgi:predicted tellurium resistance membrane protein TerC
LVRTLNWNTLLTLGLLLILLLVYVATHITVWRKHHKRWRQPRYRLYAAGQVAGLTIAIITLATSGFGKVG